MGPFALARQSGEPVSKQRSIVYVCDRCGKKEHDPDYQRQRVWWKLENDWSSTIGGTKLLCTDCHSALLEWLKREAADQKRKLEEVPKMGVYR